jgi:hypothetical protein
MRVDNGHSDRYGDLEDIGAYLAVFCLLFFLAGYTLISAAFLFSNACIGPNGQLPICPSSGPDWARPLPAGAAISGVLVGFAGLLLGRPVRTPALGFGYLLTISGLVGSWLMR